jgi:transposase InsO family protein
MSAKGNCYDNAAMESFFGRYKTANIGNFEFTTLKKLEAMFLTISKCFIIDLENTPQSEISHQFNLRKKISP